MELLLEEIGNYGVALMDEWVVALPEGINNDEVVSLSGALRIHLEVLLLVEMENYEAASPLEALDGLCRWLREKWHVVVKVFC